MHSHLMYVQCPAGCCQPAVSQCSLLLLLLPPCRVAQEVSSYCTVGMNDMQVLLVCSDEEGGGEGDQQCWAGWAHRMDLHQQ